MRAVLPWRVYPVWVDTDGLRARVEESIRRHDLIAPGGEVTCLVSGGADSTCLWHVLAELGYRGHTASDQVETLLYKLVASGAAKGIKLRREDGVVRPLLSVWREETETYCRDEGLEFRIDDSNSQTKRGLIRDEIVPRLRELHPAAERNLLRVADAEPTALDELLASTAGSRRLDLGAGLTAVREYDRVWLERTPVALDGEVRWGEWRIASKLPGLKVRAWRAGDRLAGRSKKIQDVFVDAKIPRSARESWPLVVRGDDVVAVPGVVEAEGVRVERVAAD